MQRSLSEVLENISNAPKKDRVQLLRNTDHIALRIILQYAFHPRIVWMLPPGRPPFTPNPYPDQESVLLQNARKLYLYVEGGNPNLTKVKREHLFVTLLEAVAPNDAELLIAIKDKKLPWKGITKDMVEEAFPDLEMS
jgi:hypothetical protein